MSLQVVLLEDRWETTKSRKEELELIKLALTEGELRLVHKWLNDLINEEGNPA